MWEIKEIRVKPSLKVREYKRQKALVENRERERERDSEEKEYSKKSEG